MRVYICFPLGSSFGIDYSILHMILFWELFHELESGATISRADGGNISYSLFVIRNNKTQRNNQVCDEPGPDIQV